MTVCAVILQAEEKHQKCVVLKHHFWGSQQEQNSVQTFCFPPREGRLLDNQQGTLFPYMPNRWGSTARDWRQADPQRWFWSTNALLCTITLMRNGLPFAFPLVFCDSVPVMGFLCLDYLRHSGSFVLITDECLLQCFSRWRSSLRSPPAVGPRGSSGEQMPSSNSVPECLHLLGWVIQHCTVSIQCKV